MHSYFRKFNIAPPHLDANTIGPTVKRILSDDVAHGIRYYNISNIRLDLALRTFFLPDLLADNVAYAEIKDETFILPHRDHDGIVCCINYYFETGPSRTCFYEPLDENLAFALAGETSNNMYLPEDCTEICSFEADPGSMYVLNVSKIHSVYLEPGTHRKFISWQFASKSYEEVCSQLEKFLT